MEVHEALLVWRHVPFHVDLLLRVRVSPIHALLTHEGKYKKVGARNMIRAFHRFIGHCLCFANRCCHQCPGYASTVITRKEKTSHPLCSPSTHRYLLGSRHISDNDKEQFSRRDINISKHHQHPI